MPKHAKTGKAENEGKPVEPADTTEGAVEPQEQDSTGQLKHRGPRPEDKAFDGDEKERQDGSTEGPDAEDGEDAGLEGGDVPDAGQSMVPADKPDKKAIPAHQKKSRRMRTVLIIAIVILVVLIGVLGFLVYQMVFVISGDVAVQQTTAQQNLGTNALGGDSTKDAGTTTSKKTDVPQLTGLIGKTLDESVASLAHGATVVASAPVSTEGSPVRTEVKISLTDEPGDTRSGTPTVYLGLNEEGKVVSAGYSAATSSLGYGALSFADAVTNEHIIEKTLANAGLTVPEGTVVLPADKSAYITYASDGTTKVTENCSFSGSAPGANGATYQWSAVLRYDYTTANSTGILSDTIRQIYVYVNA